MNIREKFNLKEKIDFKDIMNYKIVKKGKDTLQKKAFKAMIGFLIVMFICTLLSKFASSLTIPRVQVITPSPKNIVDVTNAIGTVVKDREEKIDMVEGLVVSYVNVNIGSAIKAGDTLLELDMDKLNETVEEINKNIKMEQKNLQRAEEDYNNTINSLKLSEETAKAERDKAKKALDDYKVKVDRDPMEETLLEQDYTAKNDAYNQAVKTSKDTIQIERALQDAKDASNLEKYNKSLASLQPYLDSNGKVIAKKGGIVTSVNVESGGVTGSGVISIADNNTGYKFIGQLEKSNSEGIKQGDSVNITLPSGVVEDLKIEAISTNKENALMLDIIVMLPVGVGSLGDSGEIILSAKSEKYGTVIPLNALRQGEKGQYVLSVVDIDTVLGKETIAKKIDVKIEKTDGEYAALEQGSLSNEENIITVSNKIIEDGDKVRLESE